MTRTIGICTSSRSERHLMEALYDEMILDKYNLRVIQIQSTHPQIFESSGLHESDLLIIPADRSEMTKFALECFHRNIPFCHYYSGSFSHTFTHDDINRWLIALMANTCFAESSEARDNLIKMGIPENRIILTGGSHFDGITNYDIEASKPKETPVEPYDLILMNAETNPNKTWRIDDIREHIKNERYVNIMPNEDTKIAGPMKRYMRLEFLYLLKHCDNFISNSSSITHEVPYLNKYCGAKIKIINPSQRNKERTPIPPEYCKGASKIIAEWCEKVDLEWLKKPKRLFYKGDKSLLGLPK